MRTEVAIIGGGPAGLLLAQLLHLAGIASVVLEKRSRAHVESRIRAGVLEPGTVEILTKARVDDRLKREALSHDGFHLAFDERMLRIDLKALAGGGVTVYGQTQITEDLNHALLARAGPIVFEADEVLPHGFDGSHPCVTYREGGVSHELHCDFIAGCDGFHGISRKSVPESAIRIFERALPFGWLGVLSPTPPIDEELVYARHRSGFALCSMRSKALSRHYVQCPVTDKLEAWPDDRFWDTLRRRLPAKVAARLVPGPAIEKSIAPLRSFVAEPMRFGRLFLAGDAAHIVPPTGAKGLNLAVADASALASALSARYRDRDEGPLERYSSERLTRVWRAVRFSWWMTALTHRLEDDPFACRLQDAEFDMLNDSRSAATMLAENYIGRFGEQAEIS